MRDLISRIVNAIEQLTDSTNEGALSDSTAAVAATIGGVPLPSLKSLLPCEWEDLLSYALTASPGNKRNEFGYVTFPVKVCNCRPKHTVPTKEDFLQKVLVHSRQEGEVDYGVCYMPSKHMTPLYSLSHAELSELITIREAKDLSDIPNRIWEGAYFLSHFAAAFSRLFDGEQVIELGAGTGLVSIGMAALSNVQKIYVTDFGDALNSISQNLQLNPKVTSRCHACDLEWLSCSDEIRDAIDRNVPNPIDLMSEQARMLLYCDIITGSDLLYSPDTAYALARLLGERFRAWQEKEELQCRFPLVLIAYTLRRKDTFLVFEEELHQYNLKVVDVTATALRYLHCCNSGIVRTGFDSLTRQGKFELRLLSVDTNRCATI